MTYYQLNCLLVDSFSELEAFTLSCRLETINDCKPALLCVGNLADLQGKLKVLELLK
jgi:hypothetical protein